MKTAVYKGDHMKAAIVCFSETGRKTALRVADSLSASSSCELYIKTKYAVEDNRFLKVTDRLPQWVKEHWTYDLLVFVGAIGIAVREIAPSVTSKKTDPAVVVLDELAKYCIPLLSGHLGGANAYATEIAAYTGSLPIVTTATDLHALFAVDVFAKKNELYIDSMALAKEVSAALLAGHTIGVYSELPIADAKLPKGLVTVHSKEEAAGLQLGISIGVHTENLFARTLHLIPKILCLGMGCRRDTPEKQVQSLFSTVLEKNRLDRRAFACLSSIDLKKDEAALHSLAQSLDVPFVCYSAQELKKVQGNFTPSSFVSSVTGVDNVCERSAVHAAEGGKLIIKKTPQDGVTAAVAVINRRIHFE